MNFTAPHLCQKKTDLSKLSYAEVLAHPAKPKELNLHFSCDLDDLNRRCKGHRKTQEITIETYIPGNLFIFSII